MLTAVRSHFTRSSKDEIRGSAKPYCGGPHENSCVVFGLELAFKFGAVQRAKDEFALPLVSKKSKRHPSRRRAVPVKLFRAIRPTAAMRVAKQLHCLGDLFLQDRVHLYHSPERPKAWVALYQEHKKMSWSV